MRKSLASAEHPREFVVDVKIKARFQVQCVRCKVLDFLHLVP